MKRGHALLISLVVGAALLFGIVAARHTAHLARSSQAKASPAELAVRSRILSREEAKLRRILAQRPPASRRVAAAQAPRVVYVRPKPHVVTVHRAHGGELEAEGHDHEGEFDD
jgi:hypothetical protein